MSIVIGTWPLSGDFGPVRLDQIAATLRTCVDCGLLEFDTAPSYGDGFIEACLGKELAAVDHVKINTKVGNRPFRGKSFAVADLTASFEESLRRLAIERTHILFLHNPRDEVVDYEPILRMFESLKQHGKIQKSGISLAKGGTYRQDLLERFDVIQDDANLLNLSALQQVAGLPEVQFMARSPLATGVLGGHINQTTRFPQDDHRSTWLKGERLESIVRRVDRIRQVCDLPLPELACRFLLCHGQINDVICGVRRPEHAIQLAACRDSTPLDQRTISELTELWNSDFGLVGEEALGY